MSKHKITNEADRVALEFLGQLQAIDQAPPARANTQARDRFFRRRQNFYAAEFGWPSSGPGGSGHGGFDAGRVTRVTDGWQPREIGPNRMTSQGGQLLRRRARDLVTNNPHAFAGVEKFAVNVVGPNNPNPKPQFENRDARQSVIQWWNRWTGQTAHSTRECDITEDGTIHELFTLWLVEMIVGGGCLVHFVERPRAGRVVPLAVELIPEERFAEHLLRAPGNPRTANPIEQGIEYDQATGKAVAYWVEPAIPHDSVATATDLEPIRIPRERAEYGFIKRRIGARRGWTLLAPAVQWLYALGYYTDAEMVAADAKSSWAYMINTGDYDFDWQGLTDSDPETGTVDIHGNPIEKLEPGSVYRGFPGDEIKAVGPNVPQSESLPWITLIQQSIAAGIAQSYEEVTGDYSRGNMSSVRMAAESVRRGYRLLAKKLIHHFANPTYLRFTDAAVREGLAGYPSPAAYLADRDEWLRLRWTNPSWASPNPVHDANAAKILKQEGLASDQDLVETFGGDVDDLYDDLEREKQEKIDRGLLPDPPLAAPGGPAAVESFDDEDIDDDEETDPNA